MRVSITRFAALLIAPVWIAVFVVAAVALGIIGGVGHNVLDSTYVFIVLIGCFLALIVWALIGQEPSERISWWRWPAVALAIAVPGFVLRLSDGHGNWACIPNSFLFQPHAAWHLLGAAGLLMTYDMFAQLGRDRPVLLTSN